MAIWLSLIDKGATCWWQIESTSTLTWPHSCGVLPAKRAMEPADSRVALVR